MDRQLAVEPVRLGVASVRPAVVPLTGALDQSGDATRLYRLPVLSVVPGADPGQSPHVRAVGAHCAGVGGVGIGLTTMKTWAKWALILALAVILLIAIGERWSPRPWWQGGY